MASNGTPSWLDGHPLIMTGSWDNTPIFKIRRGQAGAEAWAAYPQRYSPAAVPAMSDLGVNLVTVDFMKCFGLDAELGVAESIRPFIDACKQAGIRVGYYVGSTLGYETMKLEAPESEEWLVRNPSGGFLYYVDPPDVQSFRARVYFPHPGYREYIKKVLHAAIVDFQADQIHFDSASVMAEEPVFYHPRAIQDFRRFLEQRYSPDELKNRLGFPSPAAVLPPRADDSLGVTDPLVQEWIDFRCRMLVEYFAEMREYIRGINPEVAIAVNTVAAIAPPEDPNMEFLGVDHSRLLPLVDILWNEEDDFASYDSNVLVSRIRSYKMVSRAGKRMLTYTGGGDRTKLMIAESMVYNRETLGMLGDPTDIPGLPGDQRDYVEFYRNNFDCYRGVETVAEVAVLYSYCSMAYNSALPRSSSLLVHQALIQAKVPFDIIFDDGLENLSRYRVLVLPDQECLEEPLLGRIRAFVSGGGGLVATESASLLDNRRRQQSVFGLADLFGVSLPPPAGTPPVRRQVDGGRVVYIQSVIAPKPLEPHYPLPVNWTDLIDGIRWAAGGRWILDIDAPLFVTTELTRDAGGRCFVHLLNYNAETPVTQIGVRLRLPEGRSAAAIDLLTPAHAAVATVPATVDGGVAACIVPILETYAMLRVTFS